MKKKVEIEKVLCDICGADAIYTCANCHKDVCTDHALFLCKRNRPYPSAIYGTEWISNLSPEFTRYSELKTLCSECADLLLAVKKS